MFARLAAASRCPGCAAVAQAGREDRHRDLRRPGGPFHRPRGDGRPHRGHGRGGRRPSHHLGGRGRRRRLEVERRRAPLQAGVRQAQPVDRRDRDRPEEPEKVVWVGTGETWTRNSVSVGDGVYKTTDGGDNWQRMGLENTERIARIVIDPRAPRHRVRLRDRATSSTITRTVVSTARATAARPGRRCCTPGPTPGAPTSPGPAGSGRCSTPRCGRCGGSRGLLHLRRPAERPLQVHRRWRPRGSRMRKGLPAGDLGRIAVAVAPSKPSHRYATVEAKKTALYRSDDGGGDAGRRSARAS